MTDGDRSQGSMTGRYGVAAFLQSQEIAGVTKTTAFDGPRERLPHEQRMVAQFGPAAANIAAHTGQGQLPLELSAEGAEMDGSVAFASTDPAPGLVAHEVTHVLQRQNGVGNSRISQPNDAGEREAHRQSTSGPASPICQAAPAAINRSVISWLVKTGVKKGTKEGIESFLKSRIKARIKQLVDKNARRRFFREADDILGMLDDPWWVTGIGFIPILGDAFDLVNVSSKIKRALKRADQLEEKFDKLLDLQMTKAIDCLPATLRRSPSFDAALAEKTYGEILKLAKSDASAKKMKKLIEQQARLMGKL